MAKQTKAARLRTQRAQQAANRDAREVDIGECANPARRKRALRSVWDFGQTYYADRFYLPPAPVHRELADKLDEVVKRGGNYALVLPRGSAKTTWMEIGVMFAMLGGHRRFVVVVAGTAGLASDLVDRVKSEIECNDLLAEDFPEVAAPVRHLEGIAQRAKSVILPDGTPIGFEWKTERAILPPVPGSPCAGSLIVPRGIEANLRGLLHKLPDNSSVRPDLVLVDDPQTRESAASPHQCAERLATINGDLLGLAGPRKKIAALVAATVIKRGDVADQLTDPKVAPAWQGKRVPMVLTWPTRKDDLWLGQYAELRREAQRAGDTTAKPATDFYAENRAEMDDGGSVYWPERHHAEELSGLQSAFNLLIDQGEGVFFSEYQNDPKPPEAAAWDLGEQDVLSRLSKVPRGRVPESCALVTVSGDLNLYGIHWTAQAWTMDGVGYVIDHGQWPGGERKLWTPASTATEEQAIYLAVTQWIAEVCARPYTRQETGERVPLASVGIDCGYKPDAIKRAVQQARLTHNGVQVIPVRGFSGRYYRPMKGDRMGDGWHIWRQPAGLVLCVNADVYRERAQKAFLLPPGCVGGSLALYGAQVPEHRVYAEHVTAERVVDVLEGEKSGRVYHWGVIPGRRNDWLDATVYGLALASYHGVMFGESGRRKANAKVQRPVQGGAVESAQVVTGSAPPPAQRVRPGRPMPGRGGWVSAW